MVTTTVFQARTAPDKTAEDNDGRRTMNDERGTERRTTSLHPTK
jgi:hypothetical protein